MIKYPAAWFCAAAITFATSCTKQTGITEPTTAVQPIAPAAFNFTTTKNVAINVKLLTNENAPLSGVLVNVYGAAGDRFEKALLSVMSGSDGTVSATVSIPAYIDTLYLDPAYIGLMRNAKAIIRGSVITGIIGGSQGYGGDIVENSQQKTFSETGRSVFGRGTKEIKYNYFPFDKNGRPTNLVNPSDVVSSSSLANINTSLPENKAVTTHHPQFLGADAVNDIRMLKAADVWVTFVSEGAGYYNTLGYYTYPTNQPPTTESDISDIHVVMPNASLAGAGGGMVTGDKLYLGHFEANVSIGFVLLQNAWNPNSGKVQINANTYKFFTQENLNSSETNSAKKRHAVLLFDDVNQLFITGFEDQTRSDGKSDDDFNDLLIYTSANVLEAISANGVSLIDTPNDADGDGVKDVYDKFPKDATRAFIQYYPSAAVWGTLSFEDLWPATGDYDLNDLVVGYRYQYIQNAQGKTVEMYGDYTIRAIGASFINGFGVELPIAAGKVSSVTGQRFLENYITLGSNGTEAGQTNAVIFPFDDTRALHPSGGFLNVSAQIPHSTVDTAHLYVKFTAPLSATELPADVYNPFLISNQRRGYEVHLPGTKPTGKADKQLFGTGEDVTSTTKNIFYKSAENWPWAMHFVEEFEYPGESNNVSAAYLDFLSWAKSGGSQQKEWYKDKGGNRNTALIYKKK